jgi:hypothetical protein
MRKIEEKDDDEKEQEKKKTEEEEEDWNTVWSGICVAALGGGGTWYLYTEVKDSVPDYTVSSNLGLVT